MFKRDNGAAAPSSRSDAVDTVIGESSVFEGVITASSALRVDGTVKGNIVSKSTVIIGASGKVIGNVKAQKLLIAGNIEGNVAVSDSTEFSSGGYLKGDITTTNLVVEQGAAFDGKCKMRLIDKPAAESKPAEIEVKSK